jgi:cytochrome b561
MDALDAGHDYAYDPEERPRGRYHTNQQAAHWLIVFLVVFQFFSGPAMEAAMTIGYVDGALPPAGILYVHGIIGTAILLTMLWRVSLRVRFGAPPPPDTIPRPLQILARATHYTFYAILIAMPLAGIAAVFFVSQAWAEWLGYAHGITSYVLLGVIALHLAGNFVHIVKRDGTIRRMGSGQAQKAD